MRGYFGIGLEGVGNPANAGALFRTAHAFGASFVFTVAADYSSRYTSADTSRSLDHLPRFDFPDLDSFLLPQRCVLVGVELDDGAVDLPVFPHPRSAAYVLGPELGSLSPGMRARCRHLVRIPTRFSLNLATAGAIVLYDRMRAGWRAGGPPEGSTPGGGGNARSRFSRAGRKPARPTTPDDQSNDSPSSTPQS